MHWCFLQGASSRCERHFVAPAFEAAKYIEGMATPVANACRQRVQSGSIPAGIDHDEQTVAESIVQIDNNILVSAAC